MQRLPPVAASRRTLRSAGQGELRSAPGPQRAVGRAGDRQPPPTVQQGGRDLPVPLRAVEEQTTRWQPQECGFARTPAQAR